MKLNKFRGYLAFSKAAILDGFAYKFSFIGWVLGDLLSLAIMVFLWQAIYKNNPTAEINGFTFSGMLSYLIMARIATILVFSSNTFWFFSYEIMQGDIAVNLIKPINYRFRLLSVSCGNLASTFIIMFIPLCIIGQGLLYFLAGMELPSILTFIYFFITVLLSFLIFESFDFLIGQLAVYTQSLFGIYIAKAALFAFLSGAALPTSFFPEWLRNITKILPLSSLIETPVLIYTGKLTDLKDIALGWLIQLAWIVGLLLVTNFTFGRLRKKIVSVGG